MSGADMSEQARRDDADHQARLRMILVDDVRLALGEIYSGAETLDAEELVDHLERRGLRVVRS